MNVWNLSGAKIEGAGSVDAILKTAGLDWNVEKRQVYAADNSGALVPVTGRYAPARTDTGAALGVVGSQWEPLQNRTLVEFAASLRGVSDELVLHKAGAQSGGRRVFVEMRVGRELVVKRGGERDATQAFISMGMAHDGSGSVVASEILRRLTCTNGITVGTQGTSVSVRHTSTAQNRLEVGAKLLKMVTRDASEYVETMQRLADTPMDRTEFIRFAAQVFTGKDTWQEADEVYSKAEGRSLATLEKKLETVDHLFRHGIGNKGRDRFDGLNSITEFIDHQRGRSEKWLAQANRMQIDAAALSATFGDGAKVKQRAMRLLTRW